MDTCGIVVMDANAVHQPSMDATSRAAAQRPTSTLSLLHAAGLIDTFRECHPVARCYTHRSTHGEHARLDLILIKPSRSSVGSGPDPVIVFQAGIYDGPWLYDHKPTFADFALETREERFLAPPEAIRYSLKFQAFIEHIAILQAKARHSTDEGPTEWDDFCEAAAEALGWYRSRATRTRGCPSSRRKSRARPAVSRRRFD